MTTPDLASLDRMYAEATPAPTMDDERGWAAHAAFIHALYRAYPALAARIRHLEQFAPKMPSFGPDDPLNFMCDPVSVENEKLKARIRELEAEVAYLRKSSGT